MSKLEARWFVQTENGNLHGYYRKDYLLIDLAARRADHCDEKLVIYERKNGFLRLIYEPVTEESLRQEIA